MEQATRTADPLAAFGPLERALLSDWQRGLPVASPRPFAEIGRALGVGEEEVLAALASLAERGVISRVGPVFRPHAVGASTLAALAVPAERLERVADWVSGFPEVNHNYEREHALNLWFVVTAADRPRVDAVLDRLRAGTGLTVLDLPLLADYHIDLGFPLDGREGALRPEPGPRVAEPGPREPGDEALIAALQPGLPLVPEPYAAVAESAGWDEAAVRERLAGWLGDGTLRRLGLVVRHHELGYMANGMAVWDIPDDRVEETGRAMARRPWVTLCYRRPRRPPQWPYNLFTMVHGQDRERVRMQVARLAEECGAADRPHTILFSQRRFKQRGARYR